MHKLAGNVYVENSFNGVTVGAIVTKDGIIVVDTPTRPSDARAWREKLLMLSPKPILYVINTDHHRDRVLGNQWFDAPVIAQDWVGERMRLYPELVKSAGFDIAADYELMRELAGVRVMPPHITFSNELTLLRGDREIIVQHVPAQSRGAAWVLVPDAGVVFTGDSVVLDTHPRFADADLGAWMGSLDELRKAKYPAKIIVPGRGKPIDKAGVKFTLDYLKAARKKLDAMTKGGRTRADSATIAAELIKQFPVPDAQRDVLARRLRADVERWYDVRKGGLE